MREPTVTIGLPVYNGEAYLQKAIDSALSQSFSSIELIISDNASTDASWAICEAAAALDRRVKVFRNNKNYGATYNYRRVLELASGRYFKWLAHDDIMYPECIEQSVRMLEGFDEILCYSAVDVIDEAGKVLYSAKALLPDTVRSSPSKRFDDAILLPHNCLSIFGVARTAVLRDLTFGSHDGADRAMVAELTLIGPFAYSRAPLFQSRDHSERYIRKVRATPDTSMSWWDTSAPPTTLHYWILWRSYYKMIGKHVQSRCEIWLCRWALVRWLFVNWHALHLAADVIGMVNPQIFPLARRIKQRIFPPREPVL